jgi:hypothetical protein
VNGTTLSLSQVPDWTIFDNVFANEPTRLATSEFVDRVRTSGAALTPDPAEPSGQVMREACLCHARVRKVADRKWIRSVLPRSSNGHSFTFGTLAEAQSLQYEKYRNVPMCNINSV